MTYFAHSHAKDPVPYNGRDDDHRQTEKKESISDCQVEDVDISGGLHPGVSHNDVHYQGVTRQTCAK